MIETLTHVDQQPQWAKDFSSEIDARILYVSKDTPDTVERIFIVNVPVQTDNII